MLKERRTGINNGETMIDDQMGVAIVARPSELNTFTLKTQRAKGRALPPHRAVGVVRRTATASSPSMTSQS